LNVTDAQKHKNPISFCGNELILSIRCLEIL